MKKYIYVDMLIYDTNEVEAEDVQVTSNGELLFLSSLANSNDHIVAGIAPGMWMRFWEEGEIPHLPEAKNNDR